MILEPHWEDLAACVDLTTLTFRETEEDMLAFWDRFARSRVQPAAVCIPPIWVSWVHERLAQAEGLQSVALATVANFPTGSASLEEVLDELDWVRGAGAKEVDVVFPWQSHAAGVDSSTALHWLAEVRAGAGGLVCKLILETGGDWSAEAQSQVADWAVEAGFDFLKTSTGKLDTGATDAGWSRLLQASRGLCGVKASGGIRTWEQVAHFFEMYVAASGRRGERPDPRFFRIGTSGLPAHFPAT